MAQTIGILTAGGDSPGLNAAIRAVGKAAQRGHGMKVIGFRDGFQGLMENRYVELESDQLSGILTRGGTVLGTSRAKVHKVDLPDGTRVDGRDEMKRVVEKHDLKAVVCLGGDGTARNALKLEEVGIPVLTLPKTIDNDIAGTDVTFGFDTAMTIATDAIDRLHSTAHSHHRIMLVELMGHSVGWLALAAGLAGGADVILLPEIPHDIEKVAQSIIERKEGGSSFSIVAVAEGAIGSEDAAKRDSLLEQKSVATGEAKRVLKEAIQQFELTRVGGTNHLAGRLEELTGLEARLTILGHVQRGGTPSPTDRLLATRLGTACADFIAEGMHGVMVAEVDGKVVPVSLEVAAGPPKSVPLDHPWIRSARNIGISLGD
ncbi:MAG: ATP-dependent 6-phosphofructokinase [Acidimicrobiia bacterium]|nr:ATP-dependent 6-phosphofructokinase [Acidimicrobiia bacterium]